MELLRKNEKDANLAVAKVMRITLIVFTVVLILNILGIFVVNMTQMIISYVAGGVFLLIPTLVVNVLKKSEKAYTKYLCVVCAIVFTGIVNVILPKHAILLYVYPIAISSLYFSGKLNIFSTVFTIITVSAAQLVSFYIPCDKDANFTDFKGVVLFGIVPRAMVLFAISMIFIMLCKRTTTLLGSLMSAEQQEIMRRKSLEVSERLLNSVSELDRISTALAESNRSIADESADVMSGSEQNSEKIVQVEENMKSISESLSELSEMSSEIADLASESKKLTAENDELINSAFSTMNKVFQSTDESREVIRKLSDQSKEIVGIANVITDISRQTNILAINASIEASRAGQYGKGFAVVAEEIGSLSGKTNTAVSEISGIVDGITRDINRTVESMKKNAALTRESMDFMEQIKESAERVSASGNGISTHITSINEIIGSAARNGESVSQHISEVSGTIRENAGAVHHVADSIRENSSDAAVLGDMVKDISQMATELEKLTQ